MVLTPAQSNHDSAQCVEYITLVLQVIKQQSRDEDVSLLVTDFWVEDTVSVDDTNELIRVRLDHLARSFCTNIEPDSHTIVLDLFKQFCVLVADKSRVQGPILRSLVILELEDLWPENFSNAIFNFPPPEQGIEDSHPTVD